jgi:hypothetical protein
MLHRTGKREGTIHAINQISQKLGQIKQRVRTIPGEDGQDKHFLEFVFICNIRFFYSFIELIVLVKLCKYYQEKLVRKNSCLLDKMVIDMNIS